MHLLDLPSEVFVPGERDTEDPAVWDLTLGLKRCRDGAVVLPAWTTEEQAMAVWLALPAPPPVIRVPTWNTILDVVCRSAASHVYLDPAADDPLVVGTGDPDPARLLPLCDEELWPVALAHLEEGGIHPSFANRLRALWTVRPPTGWTEFWQRAVKATADGRWNGAMICRACRNRWRSFLPEPPGKCLSCSAPAAAPVLECPE